jgi:hypothetical protein
MEKVEEERREVKVSRVPHFLLLYLARQEAVGMLRRRRIRSRKTKKGVWIDK